ncbi:hypothetical protein ACFP81_09485 [Deinococcus lacus]|uniref:Alpha/beta hydrolase n=1 Tax=Deinococcus lacus TaxID=392561 RepID=A0ABW1YDN1_9DEIO
MSVQYKALDITGYRNEPLANHFFHQEGATAGALVLPGMGYGPRQAGLSYPIELLTGLGYDVLALESRYGTPEFRNTPDAEALAWLQADAVGAFQAGNFADKQEFCLMGKSIGTIAMTAFLAAQQLPEHSRLVWLTPLLQREQVRQSIVQYAALSLVVIGSADPAYRQEWLDEVAQAGATVTILEGADHGFMVEGDAVSSVERLGELVGDVKEFLS